MILEIAFLQVFFKFQSSCALRRAIIFMSFAIIFFVVKMTTPKQVFKRKYYPFLRALSDCNWEVAVLFQQLLAVFPFFTKQA